MTFSALQRSNPLLAINHYTLFGEARHRLEKLRVIVDQSMMATPEVLAARMKDPVTFPCGHPSINYMRRGIECTCTGCIVPRCAPTPDGEDTPKWTAQQAQLEDDDERIGQPNFSDVEKTPTKSKLPEGYDPTTGHTRVRCRWRRSAQRPCEARDGRVLQLATTCCAALLSDELSFDLASGSCDRPSVPGHTSTPSKPPGPWFVDTPPRGDTEGK